MKHALRLVHREGHRHRFRPECECERWVGIPVRRRQEAEAQYRRHVQAGDSLATRRRLRSVERQPITPPDRLPEALRSDGAS